MTRPTINEAIGMFQLSRLPPRVHVIDEIADVLIEGAMMAKGAARPKGTPDEPELRRLIVGLTPELDQALRARAELEDRPLAWLVRKALTEYLNPSTR